MEETLAERVLKIGPNGFLEVMVKWLEVIVKWLARYLRFAFFESRLMSGDFFGHPNTDILKIF